MDDSKRMNTVPRIGLSKLRSLKGRERLFHVAWGLVRWLALALGVVAVCTFIDFRVDKVRETPIFLRVLLTVLQVGVLAVAGWFWLIRPWVKGPSIIRLARRVEGGIPEFDHRLVTSIQLTRGKDNTFGMSPELIETIAQESETISRKHKFTRFADTRRLKWAGALVSVPMLLLAGMLLLYGPTLFKVPPAAASGFGRSSAKQPAQNNTPSSGPRVTSHRRVCRQRANQ